jgi:NAD(P)-dependent dehydrogenase (short-subunit alcohol dehydrogenase family)
MAARNFGFSSTTDEVISGLDLSGKTAVVTGASGGLGAETVRALATGGAAVTIGCRDTGKGQRVADSIKKSTGNDAIHVAALELVDQSSIRSFADDIGETYDALNILINNAGVMACPKTLTAEGWELQFATNHLGHFLLTNLLAPLLVAGNPSRVVCLSSAGHKGGAVDFSDLHFEHREYDKWVAYGQAKTANALFAVGFDHRMAEHGVRAFAVHPGAIPTDLGRHMDAEDMAAIGNTIETTAGGYKDVAAGAATSVWAATAPELDGKGGLYLEDCGESAPAGTDGITTGFHDYAVDPKLADRLWKVSEEMLGQKF